MLSDDRAIADPHTGIDAGIEVKVLWIVADDREWMDDDARAEHGAALDHRVGVDRAAFAEHGARLHNRGRVNGRGHRDQRSLAHSTPRPRTFFEPDESTRNRE